MATVDVMHFNHFLAQFKKQTNTRLFKNTDLVKDYPEVSDIYATALVYRCGVSEAGHRNCLCSRENISFPVIS